MKRIAAYVALLRGINVGGRNRIPMAELRSVCAEIGCSRVETHIQSGNVVFATAAEPTVIEAEIEKAIERHFGLRIPVIVRAAAAWAGYLAGNPFPDAARSEPNLLMMALAKASPNEDAESALRDRAASGERIAQVGDALWIHFAGGVARSKLSPTLFDRLAGSPVTMRNWRTVCALGQMAERQMKVFES